MIALRLHPAKNGPTLTTRVLFPQTTLLEPPDTFSVSSRPVLAGGCSSSVFVV